MTGKHNVGSQMKAVFPEYVNSLVKKEMKEIVTDEQGRPLDPTATPQPTSPRKEQEKQKGKEREQEKEKEKNEERDDSGESKIAGQYIDYGVGPKSSPQYIDYEADVGPKGAPQYIDYGNGNSDDDEDEDGEKDKEPSGNKEESEEERKKKWKSVTMSSRSGDNSP